MSMEPIEGPKPAPRRRLPWRRALVWVATGFFGAVLAITAAFYFDEYTEGNEFCGTLCHPNLPEYVTHQTDAHANVICGTCHIGPGLAPKVLAKIYGVGELVSLVTNSYERPIPPPVSRLRLAEEICQQCHTPGVPAPDLLYSASRFAEDEQNTETQIHMALRIGGANPALGSTAPEAYTGIHWHAGNTVWYRTVDVYRQGIPWVAVEKDGQLVEYSATDSSLSASDLEKLERRQMDCLDCHNRENHEFRNPERLLDEALAAGRIDPALPSIKLEASRYLNASYPTQASGIKALAGFGDIYRGKYPNLTSAQREALERAVPMIQEIYRQTFFPEMKVDWRAYPNNIGHTDFPGCFRCHDNKHVNAEGNPIPANCTTCHSVPVTVKPATGEAAPVNFANFVGQQPKPASHQAPDFLVTHRTQVSEECAECHGEIKYGTNDSSFCANSACHGQTWPGRDVVAAFVHPVPLVGAHAEAACADCHQGQRELNIEDCDACHDPPSQPHFGPTCNQCHTPEGWRASVVSWTTSVPTVPHRVEGATECTTCHGAGSSSPMPANHTGFPDSTCATCHRPAPLADVPPVTHVIEDRSNCLTCHGADQLAPVPSDHQGWSNASCLLCHQQAQQQ